MQKRKVLVCGVSGFIGRNIAERLLGREDLELTGTYFKSTLPKIPNVDLVCADLTKWEDVVKVVKDKDIIIQMAAVTSGAKDIAERPYIHVAPNNVMNSWLLQAAYDFNVKHFIFPSCTVMYQPNEIPVKETDFDASKEILPNYFGAGNTKVNIEKMCEFFSRLGRTKFTVMRHSNIYGPYDKFDLEKSHVFGATMTKVITAKDGKINVWGAGEEKRDLIYISDLVDFIEKAIDTQQTPFELCNVGSGEAISVNDLVKKIIQASGKELRAEHDLSKPVMKTSLCVDITKAKEKFGWKPKISLDEGVKKTMRWYQENILKNENKEKIHLKLTKQELIDFESEIRDIYEQGEIKSPIHLSGGNEDQLIEIFKNIKNEDWVFSTWRSHYHALLKTGDKEWLRNEILKNRSLHINSKKYKIFTSAIVGGIIPIALGTALAIKRKNLDRHVWCFVGDMSSESGIFHECTKYAGGHNLPITFIIEDNGTSVYTPTKEVWKEGKPNIIKYKYERVYPHYGIGKWVDF